MASAFSRRPSAEWRVIFLAFVMLCAMGALIAKLWWEQVARGQMWSKKIANRSEVTVRIPSVRGEIRDRNGVTLVANRASYEVNFYLPDMVRGYRAERGSVPINEYLATVRNMKTKMKEADIVQIVNDKVQTRLEELKLRQDYNSERLQKHYRNDTLVPFTYQEELSFPTIARFSEHDIGLPGVEISVKPVRQYVYGALGAHLLGYVGAPPHIDELPDVKDYTFYQPDVEGKSQIEKAYDKWIRGTPGVRVMARNVKGTIEGETRRVAPKQGNNIYLTIDARIQYIAERALRMAGIGRGAAVVVNPKNGEILAMATIPSYDPNVFIPSVSSADWQVLNDDETDPLTNRAISSYAPGSTYKTVTALAGLRKGIPSNRTYNCSGGVTYGNKYMKCWIADKGGSHGTLSLPDALKHSCNCFFYQWGNAAGIDNIDAVGEQLGLGKKSGIPLTGESPGILPSPNWLKVISPSERWSDGYTANTSIGQGFVLASPLQMAMVTATIANRGVSFEPRLVMKVVDQDGVDVKGDDGKLVAPAQPIIRADLHAVNITDAQIESVREGMRRVVADGTGKRAQIKGVTVAGKTGTAQFWRGTKKDNHTWFITFAPYEDPKLAICVMVQGAKSGGGVSAPIAQKIMEECFALEKGYDPGLVKLEPAKGSFVQMEMVDFKKSAVPSDIAGQIQEDRETADHTGDPLRTREGQQVGARPDIRADADARGKLRGGRTDSAPVADKRNFFQRFFRCETLRTESTASQGGRPSEALTSPVLKNLYPKLLSMTERVKRLIGLAPRQTGNKLIINAEKLERRVALLEGGILEEYSIERETDRNIVGSIFKGRVRNIEHGLKAMFVDIGFEKNAFLHFWDALPAALDSGVEQVERAGGGKKESKRITAADIPKIYPVGSEVLVQVTKGPISTKGPRITTNLSLAGRFLVLMPYSDQSGISRKIESPKERDRLRKILKDLNVPENMGVIVRTVGEGQKARYFVRDLAYLLEQWKAIEDAMKAKPAPACVFAEPDLIERTVRDFLTDEIDEVICDDENAVKRMIEIVGQISRRSASRIRHYQDTTPIFERYNVQKQIDDAFHRQVWLPCGGYIVIDETEALIAIDVNTGRNKGGSNADKTILQTNVEAADEMARQMRLRNIGGLIIGDFIDMKSRKDQQQVYQRMKDRLKRDKSKTHVLPISPLGLMEMTRQRAAESISGAVFEPCPYCSGRGKVKSAMTMSVELQRSLHQVMRKYQDTIHEIKIIVHPHVLNRLRTEDEELLVEIERRYAGRLTFRADPTLHHEKFTITDANTGAELKA